MQRYNFDLDDLAYTPLGYIYLRRLLLAQRDYTYAKDKRKVAGFFRSGLFSCICEDLNLDEEAVIEAIKSGRRPPSRWN